MTTRKTLLCVVYLALACSGASAKKEASGGGPVFGRQVTLGFDDGLPMAMLWADPLSKGHMNVTVESKLLPVQVLKVRFIPASTYSATLSIDMQGLDGMPGSSLGSKPFTVAAGDVDKWFTVDISDLNLVVNSSFWVTVTYPAALGTKQTVLYGGLSSTGGVYYEKPGSPLSTVDLDEIMRVVVATANDDAPAVLGNDGDPCKAGVECASGYCSGALCTVTCPAAGCGVGRRCQALLIGGEQACVTACSQNSDCASEEFCLVDATHNVLGLCVRGGPFADGMVCTQHYNTICKSGHCSSCDNDAVTCSDIGTCQAKQ